MINFAHEEEAQAMETYHTWVRLFELLRYYSWIVDRFHISTRVYQLQIRGVDYPFRWLEQRLPKLGFHLVCVTRSPISFEAAQAERLKVTGNASQYEDLTIFIQEQELFKKLVSESILPTLELEISGDDIPEAADRIADWMEATGGIWTSWITEALKKRMTFLKCVTLAIF